MPEKPEKGFFKSFDPSYIQQKAKKLDTYLKEVVSIFQPDTCPAIRKFFETQMNMPRMLTPSMNEGGRAPLLRTVPSSK